MWRSVGGLTRASPVLSWPILLENMVVRAIIKAEGERNDTKSHFVQLDFPLLRARSLLKGSLDYPVFANGFANELGDMGCHQTV